MAWDSKSASRRRQNSSAASSQPLPHHTRQKSQQPPQAVEPKSAIVADPFLNSFLTPDFDPAAYLNSSLPTLQSSASAGVSYRSQESGEVPLAELSSQAQTLLSQLNAHTTRLTNTLTSLTDDILRSGSRLAYEVELLRGETLSLSETLTDGLRDDIVKFVPGGIQDSAEVQTARSDGHNRVPSTFEANVVTAPEEMAVKDGEITEPQYITQLRTLTLVRSRLDSVVKTFGDAMDFTFPPSELSVSSGFLSVSAPEPGQQEHSTEDKGQQVLKALRDEISGFLNKSEDPVLGIEKAAKRIEELKELAVVWKGTAEEKGRTKFIDSLAKMVEDKHRDLVREMDGKAEVDNSSKRAVKSSEASNAEARQLPGYGFMSQLQKLRSGL